MSQELHPFWKGVQDEFQKQGIWDTLAAVPAMAMAHPALAAGVAGAGLLAGLGTVKGLRALQGGKPLFGAKPAAEAAAEVAKKGFGWKGLAAAGGAGALGAAYLMKKKHEE
jgi:hypothetical protein